MDCLNLFMQNVHNITSFLLIMKKKNNMHILKYYTFPNLINLNKKTNRRYLLKKNINYLIILLIINTIYKINKKKILIICFKKVSF